MLFYTLAYALANLAAFAVVIIVAQRDRQRRRSRTTRACRSAPRSSRSRCTIALLSLGGLPLMAGFMAKFYVFLSRRRSGSIWLVAIGVVNSVISLYYYLRVVFVMYVREGAERAAARRPARGDRDVDLRSPACWCSASSRRPRCVAADSRRRGPVRRIGGGRWDEQMLLAAMIVVPLVGGIALSLIPASRSRSRGRPRSCSPAPCSLRRRGCGLPFDGSRAGMQFELDLPVDPGTRARRFTSASTGCRCRWSSSLRC